MIQLSHGLSADVLPKETKLTMRYGNYHSRCWFNEKENAVYTASSLTLKKHKVLAADYAEVKAFFDAVAGDDEQRLVLKKAETANNTVKTL
ncbi:MAG: hypothetical protein WKF70_01030 [Chitinophagaceae bacterium]